MRLSSFGESHNLLPFQQSFWDHPIRLLCRIAFQLMGSLSAGFGQPQLTTVVTGGLLRQLCCVVCQSSIKMSLSEYLCFAFMLLRAEVGRGDDITTPCW